MSEVNPLVDEINQLLENFKYDGTTRVIPMNIVPNYSNETDKVKLDENKSRNLTNEHNVLKNK